MDLYRPFVTPLAAGQTFAVDMDNGYVNVGFSSVGFGLESAEGQKLWEFYFYPGGGSQDYTVDEGKASLNHGDRWLAQDAISTARIS